MAIRMMTSREAYEADPTNVEIVRDYRDHEEGLVRHDKACPHYATARWKDGVTFFNGQEIRLEGLREGCIKTYEQAREVQKARRDAGHNESVWTCAGPFQPLYMRTTHVGLVLDVRERNEYDDSDFYAVVWNWEKGTTENVGFGTTRGWTYPNNAWIDATPEVVAAFMALQEKRRQEAVAARDAAEAKAEAARLAALDALEAGRRAAEALMGKAVVVKKGKHKGYAGTVVWSGVSRYAKKPTGRIGIEREDGERVFVAVGEAVAS